MCPDLPPPSAGSHQEKNQEVQIQGSFYLIVMTRGSCSNSDLRQRRRAHRWAQGRTALEVKPFARSQRFITTAVWPPIPDSQVLGVQVGLQDVGDRHGNPKVLGGEALEEEKLMLHVDQGF